jgi:hypothetical protein
MKLEDLIIPGIIVIGGYIILTKLGDFFNPSKAAAGLPGAAAQGVADTIVKPAVDTGKTIVEGSGGLLSLPGDIITGILSPSKETVKPVIKDTSSVLKGISMFPLVGDILKGNPYTSTAMNGLEQAAKPPVKPIIKTISPTGSYFTPVIAKSISHNVLSPTPKGQTPGRPSVTSLHGTKSSSGFTIGGR